LIDSDSELLVVEMTIVATSFILDFGKAYINQRPDFSESVMEYASKSEQKCLRAIGTWLTQPCRRLSNSGFFIGSRDPAISIAGITRWQNRTTDECSLQFFVR